MIPALVLGILAARAAMGAVSAELKIDPANPMPSQGFRIIYLIKGAPCKEVTFDATLPSRWVKLSDSRADKTAGCQFVISVFSRDPGEFTLGGLKAAVGGKSLPAPAEKFTIGPAPKAASVREGQSDAGSEARQWVRDFKQMIGAYLLGESDGNSAFSIESCRPETVKVAQVLIGRLKSYRHEFRFKAGCDLDGPADFRLNEPVDTDLKVRNIGEPDRIKGRITIRAGLEPGFQLGQDTEIAKGVAYHSGNIFARFTVQHKRRLSLDLSTFRIENHENSGLLTLTEFKGKPVSLKEPLSFHSIDVEKRKR